MSVLGTTNGSTDSINEFLRLMHNGHVKEAVIFLEQKKKLEQEHILLGDPNVIWMPIYYGEGNRLIRLIGKQSHEAQEKILCISRVVRDFVNKGYEKEIFTLIKGLLPTAQIKILCVGDAEESLRKAGLEEGIDNMRKNWPLDLLEAICPGKKSLTRAGNGAPSFDFR